MSRDGQRGFCTSALVGPDWKCCVQLWDPQNNRDMDLLEEGHKRTWTCAKEGTKTVTGL